ncbi:hypothetical protein D9M68_786680 [compost metagenome]
MLTDIIRNPFNQYPLFRNLLFTFFPDNAGRLWGLICIGKMTFNTETFPALLYIINLLRLEVAFCKAQVVNSIQKIGLANTVFSGNTDHFCVERERLQIIISELGQAYR